MMPTHAERITSLEERNKILETTVNEMNDKLDELLALKHKGMGAFWLASALLGTGIIGAVSTLVSWLK